MIPVWQVICSCTLRRNFSGPNRASETERVALAHAKLGHHVTIINDKGQAINVPHPAPKERGE